MFWAGRCPPRNLALISENRSCSSGNSNPPSSSKRNRGHALDGRFDTRARLRDLCIADDLNLPVVIHSGDARRKTLEFLEHRTDSHIPPLLSRRYRGSNSQLPAVGGGMPCRGRGVFLVGVICGFSGDADLTLRYHDLGCLISFAGPVTYAKSTAPTEAAQSLPKKPSSSKLAPPTSARSPAAALETDPLIAAGPPVELPRCAVESAGVLAEQTSSSSLGIYRI